MAVVTRQPPDGDQVAGHIEPTLTAEPDVMQSRVLHVLSTDPAASLVPVQHVLANVRWHQAHAFQF